MSFKKSGLGILIAATLAAQTSASAQEKGAEHEDSLSLGWNISSYSNNYGLGGTVYSPTLGDSSVHLRLSGDYAWVQGVEKGAEKSTWAPFGLFKLGAFGGHFIEGVPIRAYGGGGLVALTPSDRISSENIRFGGFGLVGLEIMKTRAAKKSMFMEMGGMGTDARADKMVGEPLYANGFTLSWGFRYYL